MRTNDARHALLARLIDHAPTFPPAALPPEEALAEDARAAASTHSFMLGRLVWPASRLAELPSSERSLSAVLDAPLPSEPALEVDAVEALFGSDLDALRTLADEVYVEMPLDHDLDDRLHEVARAGLGAKARCAGAPPNLGWFMLECRERGIPYKATAGLHHAVSTDAEYGFLNVLAAAVFQDEDALSERDPGRLVAGADAFRWGARIARADEILDARERRLRSIGSCSFFEPVAELGALGVLPL
jgi:hypothetical protein